MSYPINPIYPPGGVNGDVQKNNNGQFGKAANTDIATGLAGTSIDQTKVICTSEGIGIGTGNTPVSELEVDSSSATSPRGITSVQNSTDTNGAIVNGRKARGTRSAPSLIVTGDELAEYSATGYDGSVYLKMAKILAKAVGTVGANRIPTELSFWTATDAAPSVLTQRMVIDNAGQVGIGTSPSAPLHVVGVNGYLAKLDGKTINSTALVSILDKTGGSNQIIIGYDSSGSIVGTSIAGNYLWSLGPDLIFDQYANANIRFFTNNAEKIRIQGNGNVGIGTTFPGATLDVAKTSTYTARFYDQTASTGITRVAIRAGSGDVGTDKLIAGYLNDGTTEKWSITRDGVATFIGNVIGIGFIQSGAGVYVNSGGVVNKLTNAYSWVSTANATDSAIDTSLHRNAAGVVEINNGTPGQFRSLVASTLKLNGTTNSFSQVLSGAVNGVQVQSAAGTTTYNDAVTAASGTVAQRRIFWIDSPTLTATNASVTYTNVATMHLGLPVASTNVTFTNPAVSLLADGPIKASGFDTGDGVVKLAAGTYTPTLTNTANVSASTAYSCQYQRVGNIVTVSGKVDVTATTTLTDTQLSISLPIASNLANANECAGTAFAPLVAGQGAAILGDATNDVAIMQWQAVDTNSRAMFFTFTYRII